ncbi:hypothetical protein [Mycobacterium sp.]|jgi:hypothetical protein|uniref:hypothetical protein n=1 Tax=Mycobacterium sp. TaxID=1785 RepID=UPI002B57CE06|nr:hypothetical protein [Mycobacterium sp.]HTH89881.1 hypothetical protein [Mycobacterium sp.]
MGKKLEQALAEQSEIEAAEVDETDRPIPAHVNVSRPNRARSKVLQVRLNPEEFAAIEAIADRRGLPASTVARERLLSLIADEAPVSGVDLVNQINQAARHLKELVDRFDPEESAMLQLGRMLAKQSLPH